MNTSSGLSTFFQTAAEWKLMCFPLEDKLENKRRLIENLDLSSSRKPSKRLDQLVSF